MTANISSVLQPVDQEKLTAPMSHFDSLAEAPAPRGKNKSEMAWRSGKPALRPTQAPWLSFENAKNHLCQAHNFLFSSRCSAIPGSGLPLNERPLSKSRH